MGYNELRLEDREIELDERESFWYEEELEGSENEVWRRLQKVKNGKKKQEEIVEDEEEKY